MGPGLVALVDARAKASAVLEAAFLAKPELGANIVGPLDAIDPPVVRVGWSEPWLEPFGRGPLVYARLECFCIGDRLEAEEGYATVEGLVTVVLAAFSSDPYPWPISTVGAPRGYEVGGKSYLASSVVVRLPAGTD